MSNSSDSLKTSESLKSQPFDKKLGKDTQSLKMEKKCKNCCKCDRNKDPEPQSEFHINTNSPSLKLGALSPNSLITDETFFPKQ